MSTWGASQGSSLRKPTEPRLLIRRIPLFVSANHCSNGSCHAICTDPDQGELEVHVILKRRCAEHEESISVASQ